MPRLGSAKELGRQMKFGIETVFSLVNDAGGINGHQLKLFSTDDQSSALSLSLEKSDRT